MAAKGGDDPTPAVLPWVATQGRTPLSGQVRISRFFYYKGGLAPQSGA
jgi:hypothetical protein